jgi:hypothetical protein
MELNILSSKDCIISHDVPDDLQLFSTVVTYYSGDYWKCISIHDILPYMVLHDEFNDIDNNKKFDISVIICPYSLLSCVVDGHVYPHKQVNGIMTFINKDKVVFDFFNDKIKKRETDIKKLRNVFSDYNDIMYIHLEKNKKIKKLLPSKYYRNNLDSNNEKIDNKLEFHPKTLINIIEYNDSNGHNKYTMIIGAKAKKNKALGFNSEANKINQYLESMENELKFRNGFVFQMLYYTAINYFKDLKIVKL